MSSSEEQDEAIVKAGVVLIEKMNKPKKKS